VEPEVTLRLVLRGDSVVEAREKARTARAAMSREALAEAGSRRKRALQDEHAAVASDLEQRGLKVLSRTTTLLNSLTVRAASARIPELQQMPGVASVHRVRLHRRCLSTSVPFLYAPAVWAAPTSLTGRGVRVGIIDTGIDYTHADFGGGGKPDDYRANDPSRIEAGSFPTAKVVGGTDLAGDDYDASGLEGSAVPVPDDDPLDPPGDGHGTHVAGIAAGFGVLTNGATFRGPYGTNTTTNAFAVAPGVAPEALLYAIKVFGGGGSTALTEEALDWAADPNGDGNTSDRLDVVNLSLGDPFGVQDPLDPEQVAVKRLNDLGCVVVIAAGNDGNVYYAAGAPGIAPEALTVANIFHDGVAFSSVEVTAPPALAGNYACVEGEFTPRLSAIGPVSGPLVYASPNDACGALLNSNSVAGRVALLDRGTCFFSDKVRHAQRAGAIGAIVVNNASDAPFTMGGNGDNSDLRIPAVMISRSDGEIFKRNLTNGLTVKLAATAATLHPELADLANETSSRGPTLYRGQLKPDLAAPGTSIKSASAGSGSGGVVYTGTSMSCPHAAGAAALLRQLHPSWTAPEIKAALMNTAQPCRDQAGLPYPESRTGSGRIDLAAAVKTAVIARNADFPAGVSLSFGAFTLGTNLTVRHAIRLDNHGPSTSFNVAVSNSLSQPGVTLQPATNTLSVSSNSSATLELTLSIVPSQLRPQPDPTSPAKVGDRPRFHLPEASGAVYFDNGAARLHVPWHVTAQALSSLAVATTNAGLPAGNPAELALPVHGSSAHAAPLSSVFEFGALSPGRGLSFPEDGGDILAVGAASDLARVSSFNAARLFFGMATAGKWTTPQRVLQNLDIEIDLNGDGNAEYLLSNSSQGNLTADEVENPGEANDSLITVAHGAGGTDLIGGGIWNVLDPAFRDTAPYHNGTVIHSILARDVGLTAAAPAFRYRAVTLGPLGASDSTDWIAFNPARPKLDATPYGLLSTPIFDAPSGLKLTVNRGNVPAGQTAVHALVLHQHNQPGAQAELVTLRLDTPDADTNGLPDAWELAFLGKLGNAPQADPDQDGLSNQQEAAAGTHPRDASSVFKLLAVTRGPGENAVTVSWLGAPGRTYSLARSASLSEAFVIVSSGIVGTDGTNTTTDLAAPNQDAVFYRLRTP
jgi:subtilisin family serine protease